MKTLISCAYNMDNCCVEVKFSDGSMIAIDTIAVENEIADNMYQRSELDYLIYNAPLEYADLILNGDPETYLKTVTEYKPWDSWQHAGAVSKGKWGSPEKNNGRHYESVGQRRIIMVWNKTKRR